MGLLTQILSSQVLQPLPSKCKKASWKVLYVFIGFLSSIDNNLQVKEKCDFVRATGHTVFVSYSALGGSVHNWIHILGVVVSFTLALTSVQKRERWSFLVLTSTCLWGTLRAALAGLLFPYHQYISPETHTKAEGLPQVLQMQLGSNHTCLHLSPQPVPQGHLLTDCDRRNERIQISCPCFLHGRIFSFILFPS